jgi:hypothetical protein
MLPAPSTATTKPDKKKLSLFFPGISSSDAPAVDGDGAGIGTGNTSPLPGTPVSAKQARRKQMIRDGIVVFLSLALSIVFLVFGPTGDFIAGRAFTVSTTNQVTYIYYNWTLQLPISTLSLNMQAYNNRLVGSVLFAAAPPNDNHYTISVETTVVKGPFTITPWSMYESQESGFTINISDLLPNTYGIDYANIIVYLPAKRQYNELLWNTYPISTGPAMLPLRKWNVAFDNLTEAGIQFDKIRILTDGGSITSKGVRAANGYFQTLRGPITGEYTVPEKHLTFNRSGGEPSDD